MKTLLFLSVIFHSLLHASDFSPSNFLYISPGFSKNLIIVEKTKLKVHVYEVDGENIKKINSFPMAYGKTPGDKKIEGDKRTPEGIYFMKKFHNSESLIKRFGDYGKIYGAGAFTLDYPNPIDFYNKKTGNGIWLHSTDDEARISKGLDSRGCIVVNDKNLKQIANYINVNNGTPIIVVQDLNYIDKESQKILNKKIKSTIDTWALGWKEKDIKKYISAYHPNFKSKGKNLKWFKNYKKNVFGNTKDIILKLSNFSALQFEDYAVVTIDQYYESNLVKDKGLKTIYLKRDSFNEWKIISEKWERKKDNSSLADGAGKIPSYF